VQQSQASENQVGDLERYDGGEVRAWRFGVLGTINVFERPWSFTVLGETNAFGKGFETSDSDEWKVADWRLDIPLLRNSVMKIGRQKEPFSHERSQSILHNQMQERSSVTDALMRSRNVGAVWSGHSPEHYTSWHIGAFNDCLIDDGGFSENDSQYIGRATWAPFRSEDDSNLVHLGASYRYSDASKEGFRFRAEPEFNKAPLYVDTGFGTETGVLPADNTKTWNLEASWRKGPFWLSSEYTRVNVDSPELDDPSFEGYWVAASWDLTGGMRSYRANKGLFGKVPIPRSVYQNGWGSWEASTRFSHIDLEDGLVTGGEMDIASLGLAWHLADFLMFKVNYRYIWNELDGVKGTCVSRKHVLGDASELSVARSRCPPNRPLPC
jgi:phosphate-selective porin OprO/OprP